MVLSSHPHFLINFTQIRCFYNDFQCKVEKVYIWIELYSRWTHFGAGGLGVWYLPDTEVITSSNLVRPICRGSSVGRTPDWRSGCRWFKSGPRHFNFKINCKNIFLWFQTHILFFYSELFQIKNRRFNIKNSKLNSVNYQPLLSRTMEEINGKNKFMSPVRFKKD